MMSENDRCYCGAMRGIGHICAERKTETMVDEIVAKNARIAELERDLAAANEQEARYESCAKLQAFLYLLLRDHVTFGVIEAILQDVALVEKSGGAHFSEEHQAAYARAIAESLGAGWPEGEGRDG